MSSVRYAVSADLVLPGDIVATGIFFIRRRAWVVYVPGISTKRDSLEHHGLRWVGLQELTGPFFAAVVDPTTSELDKKVQFITRGHPVEIPNTKNPFVEPGELLDEGEDR